MVKDAADPASALKALRKLNGWTLADVAKMTGQAVSTISRIENRRVSLNFDKLLDLSQGLGVDMAYFLEPARTSGSNATAGTPSYSGRRSTTFLNEGAVIDTPNYRHVYHAADLLEKCFTPIFVDVLARSREEFGDLIRHSGEEFTFVVSGVIELHTDTYAPLTLKAGESVYFDSTMGHAYIAASEEPCRLLSIAAERASARGAAPLPVATINLETGAASKTAGTRTRSRRRAG